MPWIETVPLPKLKRLQQCLVSHEGQECLLVDTAKAIYAIEKNCPHQGLSLENGQVHREKCQITCNYHGWEFDLKSGKGLTAGADLKTFETKVEEDMIWVNFTETC